VKLAKHKMFIASDKAARELDIKLAMWSPR